MKIYIANLTLDGNSNDNQIVLDYTITCSAGTSDLTTTVPFPASSTDVNMAIRNEVVNFVQANWNQAIDVTDVVILGSVDITDSVQPVITAIQTQLTTVAAQLTAQPASPAQPAPAETSEPA